MSHVYLFPAISVLLNLGSASVYAAHGDIRHAIYWLAAATLTSTVTFGAAR